MTDKNTFNVLFLIKRTKLLKNGEAPIYMRITVKGDRAEIAANSSIDPKLWDQSKGQIKKGASDASSRNNYLINLRLKIQSHKRDLTDKGILVTAQTLKDSYLGILDKPNKTQIMILLNFLEFPTNLVYLR